MSNQLFPDTPLEAIRIYEGDGRVKEMGNGKGSFKCPARVLENPHIRIFSEAKAIISTFSRAHFAQYHAEFLSYMELSCFLLSVSSLGEIKYESPAHDHISKEKILYS